jgi:hypothetical protein
MLQRLLSLFIQNQSVVVAPPPPLPQQQYSSFPSLLTPDQINSITILTLSLVSTVVILWVLWNIARYLPWIGWLVWWLLRKVFTCVLFLLGLLRDVSYLVTGLLFCAAVGVLAWIAFQTDLINYNINLGTLQPFLSVLETVLVPIYRSIVR